jgi:hypothetical protein
MVRLENELEKVKEEGVHLAEVNSQSSQTISRLTEQVHSSSFSSSW